MLNKIESVLKSAFNYSKIKVIDESWQHQGHVGNTMSSESHFKIIIENLALSQMKLIDAHRAIYQALGKYHIMSDIHALAIVVIKLQ